MIWRAGGLLAVVVLQTTIAPWVQLGQVRPDRFLLVLCLGSFKMNPMQACLMGCLLGLYEDALSGAPLGLNAFTLSLLGHALVRVREEMDQNRLLPHLRLRFLTSSHPG